MTNYTAEDLSDMSDEELESAFIEYARTDGSKSALIEESKVVTPYFTSWAIKPNDPNSQGSLIIREVLKRDPAFQKPVKRRFWRR